MAVNNKRWWALAVIALAQFMVIMDTSIIGVALPKMQLDLGFSQAGLSWVFNAYAVPRSRRGRTTCGRGRQGR